MAKLNKEGKKLESLIKDLTMPTESNDFRLDIKTENFREYGNEVLKYLEKYVKELEGWSIVPINYEGIRVECNKKNGEGWFLLRLSLHEPVLALNIESDIKGGTEIIIDKLTPFLDKYNELDLSDIK